MSFLKAPFRTHPILVSQGEVSRPEIFIPIFIWENWGPDRIWLREKIELVGNLSLTQFKWTSFLGLGKQVSRHRVTSPGRGQLVNHHLWLDLTLRQGVAEVCIDLWPFWLCVFHFMLLQLRCSGQGLSCQVFRERWQSMAGSSGLRVIEATLPSSEVPDLSPGVLPSILQGLLPTRHALSTSHPEPWVLATSNFPKWPCHDSKLDLSVTTCWE